MFEVSDVISQIEKALFDLPPTYSILTLVVPRRGRDLLRGAVRLRGEDVGRPVFQERRPLPNHQQHVSTRRHGVVSLTYLTSWTRHVSSVRVSKVTVEPASALLHNMAWPGDWCVCVCES